MSSRTIRRASGFTLVELLIVVVILGILAAIAIPQFTSSSEDAQVTSLQTNLAVVRNAIEYYKAQHDSKYPGYPSAGGAPTEAEFINQLTLSSKKDGSTATVGTTGYPFGPYIKEKVPANPVNNKTSVLVIADATAFPAADDTTGWIFKPLTGKLRANSSGSTSAGLNYYDF